MTVLVVAVVTVLATDRVAFSPRAAQRPLRLAGRVHGTQCTGNRLNPQPPAATSPSTGPARSGCTSSRNTAHHHTPPRASATAQPAAPRVRQNGAAERQKPQKSRQAMAASFGRR
ncbi:hypothetical protein ACH4U6_26855 [Streptomyces netropsis]|uniref:hypothetical protein n=1 Tax=Streptomyces netropsis TaxID=55404 RepID=UPI00379DC0B7